MKKPVQSICLAVFFGYRRGSLRAPLARAGDCK